MKTIRQLLWFLKPFGKEIAVSILLGIATITAGIGMLGTSAFLISTAALHPSIADLEVAIVGVRFFGISRGIFRYLERLVSHSVNLKVLTRMRVWMYEGAEKIAPAGLQLERGGEVLNGMIADLEVLENFYVRVVAPIVVAFVITTGMSLFLGGYFLPLGVILAVGMTFNGLLIPVLAIYLTRRTGENVQKTRSQLSADMLDFFRGLEELQAAGVQRRWQEKLAAESQKSGKIQIYYGFLTGINSAASLLIMNLTLLAILLAAIPQVVEGSMQGVSLAVVSLLTMASFEATNPLPLAAQNLTASLASARKVMELISHRTEEKDSLPEIPESMINKASTIEVRHVNFHYSGEQHNVVSDLSMFLSRGKVTVLVGPSGAGKSSVVNLLLRFWQLQSGEMLLESDSLSQYSPESTRRLFGVISQQNYFFAESLRNNLLLANTSASDAMLVDVLHRVDLDTWLKTLPDGLDTWLGEQGARMSGGEAQRLALARVLLRDTPFVLLDEPTSNLDPLTERTVIHQLLNALRDKGVLLITHRLEILSDSDEVLFLEGGKVLERGSAAQLRQFQGAFTRFWELQKNQLLEN